MPYLPVPCSTHYQSDSSEVLSQDMMRCPPACSDRHIIAEKVLLNPEEDHEILSLDPGSSDSDSQMTLIREAIPNLGLQIRILDPKKNKWGYTHRTRKSDCDACGSGQGSHGFACSALRQRALDHAFQTCLAIIQHFLTYLNIDDALKTLERIKACKNKRNLLSACPDLDLTVPCIMMAMGLDWDTTCAHPFLKRLLNLYRMEEEVVCVKGSEIDGNLDGGVDTILCLKGSSWRTHQTKCDPSNGIPICPIMVQRSPDDDPMDRLRKWCFEYFDCLEKNQIAYDETRWSLPYFVVDGNWWRVGFAIKFGSTVELYDEEIGSMGWENGLRRIMVVLQCVIKLTAERHREWYLEHKCIR